jgi:nitrogenase molybdenum-cofactor synthesis protein NifE
MYTAFKAHPFSTSPEREFGYEGYSGMIELARQLALTLQSPVWSAVRKPSPWAKTSVPGIELGA